MKQEISMDLDKMSDSELAEYEHDLWTTYYAAVKVVGEYPGRVARIIAMVIQIQRRRRELRVK